MAQLRIKTADEQWGYPAGVDGWMDSESARKHLMNISWDTLNRLVADGHIRKGKLPGGKKVGYCRRSVAEFAQTLEI